MPKSKRTHNPIPWKRIMKAFHATKPDGKTAKYSLVQMATKFGYLNQHAKDPTQEFRGILSRFKTVGVKIDDKLTKLGKGPFRPRANRKASTGAPKTTKVAKKQAANVVTKAKPGPKPGKKQAAKVAIGFTGEGVPKATMIAAHSSKQFIRIEVPKSHNLVKVADAMPMLINTLHELGYDVAPKPEALPDSAPQTVDEVPETVETANPSATSEATGDLQTVENTTVAA